MKSAVRELTDDTFEDEVRQIPGWCVVDFYAQLPASVAFRSLFEEVALASQGRLKFFAADVEQCRSVADYYGIENVPTTILLHDGERVDAIVGNNPRPSFVRWLDEEVDGWRPIGP